MKTNKRGITPIMTTLLLVSFAVAVGVVVMNFGRAQAEEGAQCAINIDLKLAEIGGQSQLCYDPASQSIRFTVENGVNIKVEGLIVNIIETDKAESVEVNDAKIIKAGTYLGTVKYAAAGALQQVKLIPKVMLFDQEEICAEQALVVENIRNC